MDNEKYIGMDVHKESISIAVMNGAGKIVMECVIETKASMILEFIQGLSGCLPFGVFGRVSRFVGALHCSSIQIAKSQFPGAYLSAKTVELYRVFGLFTFRVVKNDCL